MEAGKKANVQYDIDQYWLIISINWQLSIVFDEDTLCVFQPAHAFIYINSKLQEVPTYFCRSWENYLNTADGSAYLLKPTLLPHSFIFLSIYESYYACYILWFLRDNI
jgi:hypothetical protein